MFVVWVSWMLLDYPFTSELFASQNANAKVDLIRDPYWNSWICLVRDSLRIRSHAIHHHEKLPCERFAYSFPTTTLSKSKNCNNLDGDVCLHPWFSAARIPREVHQKLSLKKPILELCCLRKLQESEQYYSDFSLEMVVIKGIHPMKKLNSGV